MNTYTASLPHTASIRSAVNRFEQDMMASGGELERDRDHLKALSAAFCSEMQALVYKCGGDGSYIETDVDNFNDTLDDAFLKAIDTRDEEPETSVIFGRDVIRSVSYDGARGK